MERINSLDDLLMEELADLLKGKEQLMETLPQWAQASVSPSLKQALEKHSQVTREQAGRLAGIFSDIGQNPHKGISQGLKGLIEEGQHAVKSAGRDVSRDLTIISTTQRIEKQEIEGYKTAREHAADLGHTQIVDTLDKILNEERSMNLHLSELAQGSINTQALASKDF